MADHINFYENLTEALLRLKNSVVTYDGQPYYIWTITEHKPDHVFRVYMSALEDVGKGVSPPALGNVPHGHVGMGPAMDNHVDGPGKIPNLPIIRKKMDSTHFNKFRPFPLGMMNYGTLAIYVERQPLRPSTYQGLLANMLSCEFISLSGNSKTNKTTINMFTSEFKDCIVGDYPTPKECLEGVLNEKTKNEVAAFHRNFALIRGPIDTLFLAYKSDIVGALPRGDFSVLNLGRKFKHVKEAVQDLKLFYQIV